MKFFGLCVFLGLFGAACSAPDKGVAPSPATAAGSYQPDGDTIIVTLPDGFEVTAELALTPEKQAQGMMFRPALPVGFGMLFVMPEMAEHGFWMYQCVIALDILWLDDNKRIVEISANTPPCADRDARNCPSYGGAVPSVYVLELPAGEVAARNLKLGDELKF